MDRKVSFVLAGVLALLLSGSARAAATFTLGFEGAPTGQVEGTTGEIKTWEIYPILTTSGNDAADGAQGWQVGLAISGADLTAITLKGVTVNCIYDEDPGDGSPVIHHDPYWQDLSAKDMFAKGASAATLETDAAVKGAIMYAVFRSAEHMVLQPNGTARLAKMTVSGTVGDGCADVRLYYLDGMKSETSKPVQTAVTFNSESIDSTKGLITVEAKFQLCKTLPPPPFAVAAVVHDGQPAETGDTTVNLDVPPDAPYALLVDLMIISQGLTTVDGPQGWQLGIAHEGCITLESATQKGVIVNTIYDEDPGDGSPVIHHDNWPQDLGAKDMFAKGANLATLDTDESVKGAITFAVFKSAEHQVLYPNAKDRVLLLSYTLPAVALNESKSCRIYFIDKMKSAVSKPVDNAITYNSESIDQTKGLRFKNLLLTWTGKQIGPPPAGKFVRGNANGDGKIDIADAVWIVYSVLQDPSYPLPCKNSGDADGDSNVGFPDAIFMINYQFMHGAPPALPFPGCGNENASGETCPDAATQANCK